MQLKKINLNDLIPYENNPRVNTAAVKEVKESINQVGYITPIVIDENYEILAGHTRYQALSELGYECVECIILDNLTEDQKRKFRLLDNKIGELAEWDLEKLKLELGGVDLGEYKGFAYLQQGEEKSLENIIDEFEEKEIRCPKCGALVDPDAD